MTILITGARGTVARSLVRQLHDAGHRVRAGGRVPAEVDAPAGVEVVAADPTRPGDLGPALAGVEKVFVYAERSGLGGFLAAAGAAGVRHVVLLSALGASPHAADAITRAHGEAERAVLDSGLEWSFVRPGGFATNRLMWAPMTRAGGPVLDPFPESQSALVHEADVAAVALAALTLPGQAGAIHSVTGPESQTARRHAELIGEAIGRPVEVAAQSLDDYQASLADRLPPDLLEARIARLAALVGRAQPTTDTVRTVTGRPARTFARWAADHAADFTG
ncbi:NAD(P)H-binding protein [Actinomadura atramentaria]|uniref:NAD(P)H-binding protein n=1 Tax=Actinomadura atramentaria TaxID=1990 RepID=UPI0003750177|nr:NAD(P)H-binding protein [Actinomadura atramentaria]